MGKIGICACYNTFNYGSMLQSFATQKVISNLGYDNEFIIYKKKITLGSIVKQIPRILNRNLIQDKYMGFQKKIKLKKHPEVNKQNEIRIKAFKKFQDDYYENFSTVYYGYNDLKKGASNYTAIVVGSDQLWTPGGLPTNFYNLMFVPDNITKISFATSFGVSRIPFYQINRTKKFLKRIQYLSVREERGRDIIEKLTGRKPEVVMDPTLLLTTDEWQTIIPVCQVENKPYIFCYFLGTNPEHRKIAKELKQKTGYQIICTPHLDEYVEGDVFFGDKHFYDIGPDYFVNLIRGAEYICTDSFHGSVFSILYHKKFVVFNRFEEYSSGSRNSRIDSLCGQLNLNSRRYKYNIWATISADIDYDAVDEKLKALRRKSLNYLKDALSNSIITRETNDKNN